MNEKLQALFTQHRTTVLGVGGAGVLGLALLQRKKKAAAAGGTSSSPAGTIPAAGVVPASGVQGAYPNTAPTDIYNGIMDQLLKQQQALTPAPVAAATPAPIASTLFAPTGTGNYVQLGQTIAEVESDGSMLGLVGDQWKALVANGATATQLPGTLGGQYFETATNLRYAGKGPASALWDDKVARGDVKP